MIPLFKVFMPKSVEKPLIKTLFSGYIGQGPKVDELEKKISDYLKTPYVITVNSGTSAIHLALKMLNITEGDEIISTPLTCTATNWPILAHNGKIVWADIDLKSANIDPKSIATKITPKTKAIMVVDWGGQPANLEEIKRIAYKTVNGKKVKIPIVEDAAHAFGSEYKGKKIGNFSDFTCFSLQAIKHITSVDGGILVVKNKADFERSKLLRWYGISREKKNRDSRIEEDVVEWGYKFHMNDINATIGLEQMKYLEQILAKHRDNAIFYYKHLDGIKNIELLTPLPETNSSYWLFTMKVKKRDLFRKKMSDSGIMASQVHRRNDTHPVVRKFKTKLSNLDNFEKEMICIPVGWWLTKKDREYIVKTIKKGW